MGRPRKLVILLGAVAAAAAIVAVVRHGRGAATGREEQGGTLIGDAAAYDAMSRLLSGSLFGPIAADIAAVAAAFAPEGAVFTWLASSPETPRPTPIRPARPRHP